MPKYNNTKIESGDGIFDSRKEFNRWRELKIMEAGGEIQDLERQKRYELIPKQGELRNIEYVADFVYKRDGKTVIEDVKPTDGRGDISRYYKNTEAWRMYMIKKKLMRFIHGLDIEEV